MAQVHIHGKKNLTHKTQHHLLKYQNGGRGAWNYDIFNIYIYIYIHTHTHTHTHTHIYIYIYTAVGAVQTNSIPGVHRVFMYVIINTSINKCVESVTTYNK